MQNQAALVKSPWAPPGIGRGHFMARFRPKEPKSMNELTPATPVRIYLKVVGENLGTATRDDLETLKAAHGKIGKKISRANRATLCGVVSLPIILFGSAFFLDMWNKYAASSLPANTVAKALLAAFLALSSAIFLRIKKERKLVSLKTGIENKLGEFGLSRTARGYWL